MLQAYYRVLLKQNILMQCSMCMTGKILLNVISPHMLCEILKNVTLCFLEGHELVAGVRSNNMYLHYEIIEAMMFADVCILHIY